MRICCSHRDLVWVKRHVLEILEENGRFSLCLHERDFEPGAAIISNITAAINHSRRVIMVLSRWGGMGGVGTERGWRRRDRAQGGKGGSQGLNPLGCHKSQPPGQLGRQGGKGVGVRRCALHVRCWRRAGHGVG